MAYSHSAVDYDNVFKVTYGPNQRSCGSSSNAYFGNDGGHEPWTTLSLKIGDW